MNEIHDILKAYYKVALKQFIDNVVLQVIKRIYLGSNSLVRAISPGYVETLLDIELANIAAKSYATSSTRTKIRYYIPGAKTKLRHQFIENPSHIFKDRKSVV